jgi:heme/copper-type cytochrome/quinol oxidase subunit 1
MAEAWEDFFQPGETLVWEGAPKPGLHAWVKLIGMALFGLPFLVIGSGVCGMGLRMLFSGDGWQLGGLGLFLTLFSMPFIGVGLFLVLGQVVASAVAHKRVRYALSNRCAYIAQTWVTRKIESYPILKSSALGLEIGRGADTVWFHVRSQKDSDGDLSTTRISFDNIADGEKVYRLLRSIQTGTA